MNIIGLDLVESRWLRSACTSIYNRDDALTDHAVLNPVRIPSLDHAVLEYSIRIPMALSLDHAIRMKYLNQ
jgi:hypothetical protein